MHQQVGKDPARESRLAARERAGRLRWHARVLAFRRWLRRPASRWTVIGTAAVVVAVIGVGVAFLLGGEPPVAAAPSASGAPSPTPTSTGAPPPTAAPSEDAEWTALTLPPYEPTAELIADEADGSGISTDGTFTLRSLSSAPAAQLAAGLVVDPPVELAVEPGPSADIASVRPATPLAENARYDISLYDDGVLAGSWTFRTSGALDIVRHLPGDRSGGVPVDTGIEIEFDQAALQGVEERFAIDPPVAGSLESHGRTWVFVPDRPLAPATLYTVTVLAGVQVIDSDVVLESDVRFAFETEGPEQTADIVRVLFDAPLREARPDEAPIIPVDHWGGTQQAGTLSRSVTLYELPTLEAAIGAVRTLAVDRSWARLATNGGVDPSGLPEVGTWDVEVSLTEPGQHLRLPTGLAEGWYLLAVAQDGAPIQLVLQVTELSAYVMASETRTIAWINDVVTGAPMPGAELLLDDGSVLGSADGAGLVDIPTPEQLRSVDDAGSRPLLLVAAPDGRRMISPLDEEEGRYWPGGLAPAADWWTLLDTDREQYSAADTIHAWGLIRSRADRSVPGGLELRLVSGSMDGAPIARTAVTASGRGVFVGDLPLREVPPGGYTVGLYVGESAVTQTWITVTEIRKPTFRIEVTTDRHAYLAGDEVVANVSADFFDGSTAPGLELRVTGGHGGQGEPTLVTLDRDGTAELRFEATTSGPSADWGGVSAEGAEPQEGLSAGSSSFVVFPSAAWITGEAVLEDDAVAVTGRLTTVDLERADEEAGAIGWVEDPSGEPLAGQTVEIDARRVNWVQVQTGTTYDFIEKRVVPVYRQDREVVPLGTFSATAGADGSFSLSIPVAPEAGGIELTLAAADDAGRRVELQLWAERPSPRAAYTSYPYLEQRTFCGGAQREAEIGETVTLTVRGPDDEPSVEGRTLFVFSQAGIQRTEVTDGADVSMHFGEADVPSVSVRAVRLVDGGYVVLNEADIVVEPDAKTIDVELTADGEGHAPGEAVAVGIRTIGPDGAPISADVVVQAVDLKLYAIGAAEDPDVRSLMSRVPSGALGTYTSHAIPSPASDCGFGAATGGADPRTDFRDVATFQRVTTDGTGTASVTFDAPDDLTSWRVGAVALGDALEAGTNAIDVPVGLPFFVDATIAPEYLVGEEPIIMLRAYGDGLDADDAVRFTVNAPSLGLEDVTFEGTAFERVRAPLPALTPGDHELTITAEQVGGDELGDGVLRIIRVVPSRMRTLRTAHETVESAASPPGGQGMTTHLVTDAGRGGLYPLLQELAWSTSARFDAQLAATMARELLIEELGISEAVLPPGDPPPFEGHPAEGLALLPYGSADTFLTARAALVAGDRMSPAHLRDALLATLDADPTRERGIVALVGLAALGDDVLADLRALASDDLTLRERAWLALGLLAAGDEDGARTIERAILTEHGQRLGPWVRLDTGADSPEAAEVSASVLLLAAGLRDPIATDLSRYLLENPSDEYLPALEQIGFARAASEWLPREEARFAWTVDGERHEEALEPGSAFTLRVTPAQQSTLTIEPLVGSVAVASSWEGEASYDELPSDPSVRIERTVTPAGRSPADGLVRVRLNVTLDDPPVDGCFQVTDLVPSGLAPVVASMMYWSFDATGDVIPPYEVEGNRVSWCVGTDRPSVALGYTARVVSAGTYRWEPAVIQAVAAPSVGAATAPATYGID